MSGTDLGPLPYADNPMALKGSGVRALVQAASQDSSLTTRFPSDNGKWFGCQGPAEAQTRRHGEPEARWWGDPSLGTPEVGATTTASGVGWVWPKQRIKLGSPPSLLLFS